MVSYRPVLLLAVAGALTGCAREHEASARHASYGTTGTVTAKPLEAVKYLRPRSVLGYSFERAPIVAFSAEMPGTLDLYLRLNRPLGPADLYRYKNPTVNGAIGAFWFHLGGACYHAVIGGGTSVRSENVGRPALVALTLRRALPPLRAIVSLVAPLPPSQGGSVPGLYPSVPTVDHDAPYMKILGCQAAG